MSAPEDHSIDPIKQSICNVSLYVKAREYQDATKCLERCKAETQRGKNKLAPSKQS